MQPQDVMVIILVLVTVGVALFLIFKNRGKCPGGCEGCAYRGECHKKGNKKKNKE